MDIFMKTCIFVVEKHKKIMQKSNSTQLAAVEKMTRYINLLTDFGFKRIFGEEANKDLLIDFLNTVLNIDGGIKKLDYGNPEKQGRVKTDSKAIFDLYCTTGKGERIIIEMQKLPQKYYKDRSLYYISFPIQEQGEKRKRWNFMLHPVYSVNIVNFLLDEETEKPADKYVSYIVLKDRDTNQLFYKKLILAFLELPRFTKKVEELQTNFERWMFILNHLHKLDDIPANLLRNRIFKKLFQKAEIANMTKEEINAYNKSLKRSRDMDIAKIEMNMAKSEIRGLQKDKALLSKDIAVMSKDIAVMSKDIAVLSKDIAVLSKDKALLSKDKALLLKDNAVLSKDNAVLSKDNAVLSKELAEYRQRYGELN